LVFQLVPEAKAHPSVSFYPALKLYQTDILSICSSFLSGTLETKFERIMNILQIGTIASPS